MHPHIILLHRDPQLLQRLLPLLLHLLRPCHLLLPRLIQVVHQLLTRLQLLLQFRLGDFLDRAVFGFVLHDLLFGRDFGIPGVFGGRALDAGWRGGLVRLGLGGARVEKGGL